jgi:Calcium binding
LSKPRKNRMREERIQNQAIVDAYGPEKQAFGWYYNLESKIKFPFSARCIASTVVSPLRKGETVDVRRLAPEDSCGHDMLVLIRWHNRNVAVPLSQLVTIDADESTIEVFASLALLAGAGLLFLSRGDGQVIHADDIETSLWPNVIRNRKPPGTMSRPSSLLLIGQRCWTCFIISMLRTNNQAFLHADDMLEPYKKTIDRWVCPDPFRNQDTSVSKAKQAISDYKRP